MPPPSYFLVCANWFVQLLSETFLSLARNLEYHVLSYYLFYLSALTYIRPSVLIDMRVFPPRLPGLPRLPAFPWQSPLNPTRMELFFSCLYYRLPNFFTVISSTTLLVACSLLPSKPGRGPSCSPFPWSESSSLRCSARMLGHT